MDNIISASLLGYWTPQEIAANINIILNLLGALFLGLLVGYERSYHGRAAGMRTYGLVCMSSCSLIVIAAYPGYWYGGHAAGSGSAVDVGRIVQGITTGIGFLGAGVIMRHGLNISGLTTAASIWAVAAIGVMVGVGFYGAAIAMSLVSTGFMVWGSRMENFLPSRHAISITLHFNKNFNPTEDDIAIMIYEHGYELAKGSFALNRHDDSLEWKFVAVSFGKGKSANLLELGERFQKAQGVEGFHITHARD